MKDTTKYLNVLFVILFLLTACSIDSNNRELLTTQPSNILNFIGTPDSATDRSSLAFSDQGAWFAYSLPDTNKYFGGFSGPFLMTQENGIWASQSLSYLYLHHSTKKEVIKWEEFNTNQSSFNSHLEQTFYNDNMTIVQKLFFSSPHTGLIKTSIKNNSAKEIEITPTWKGKLISKTLSFEKKEKSLYVNSIKSNATGIINFYNQENLQLNISDSSYSVMCNSIVLAPSETKEFIISHTFIFQKYDLVEELEETKIISNSFNKYLKKRILEKELQLEAISTKVKPTWKDSVYKDLMAKCILTLQNNWRIPAGELKHSGLFPSYHYIWFHGFWAWDSWKHSVALAKYNPELAKDQIRTMFDFQDENGFIADCVYRDTTIERHNYRNTKPPLSAWAVWKVFDQNRDHEFLDEMFPKIKKQHNWWYNNRDHDKDSLCEYGSTDGTLIAAKWESGMDNAVRFDSSELLKNSSSAFSLNQESVDLNSYLYSEKIFLSKMAKILNLTESQIFLDDAKHLKLKIQNQFFDRESGWFYDTKINGESFIEAMGCEGWIPLWANIATSEQAEIVKKKMMKPEYFNTSVPLQTLVANHPKFEPDGGYWRGPNWLDQAYFGIRGLINYGYLDEANSLTIKLINNAEGVIKKGKSIRENYNPITGEGLESENFSWSAVHYLLLLTE